MVLAVLLVLSFSQQAFAVDQWYNNTWHYREKLAINASSYDRVDWVEERDINFTSVLRTLNYSGTTFLNNSLRLFEYNASGGLVRAVPYQFDELPGYDNQSNAYGTLIFQLNGTTPANTSRLYYVYFDESYYGSKDPVSYASAFSYDVSGTLIAVNNSLFEIGLDTSRGENSSGIYRIKEIAGIQNTLFDDSLSSVTTEYTQMSDGLYNYSYNLTGSASVRDGPIRLTLTLSGNETYWNDPRNFTNAARLVKTYRFYKGLGWVKVDLNLSNLQGAPLVRNSTLSGAVAFDVSDSAAFPNPRGFGDGYSNFGDFTEPVPWCSANDQFASFEIGLIKLNSTNTVNFTIINGTDLGRIGFHLNTTTIGTNAWIGGTTLVKIEGESANPIDFGNFRNSWADRENVTEVPERWNVTILTNTSFQTYNRNETVRIYATVLSDIYNYTSLINVTIDNATPGVPGDDFILQLYDDGSHGDTLANDRVFTANYTLNTTANVSDRWTVNATVWDSNALFLGFNASSYNVTDALRVNLTVLTQTVLVGTTVNASLYVTNYRQDTPLSGASVSCNYSVLQVYDFNNGTYVVNFAAPLTPSQSNALSCNATKAGNYGANASTFITDSAATGLSIVTNPLTVTSSNITQSNNNSFVVLLSSNNTGQGTAVQGNLSLSLPAGWSTNATSYACGNVSVGGNCSAAFLVTIPNATGPGVYSVNATAAWTNPDASSASNLTTVNVTVQSNPQMNVSATLLFSYVAPGVAKAFGSFNVSNSGNDILGEVNFSQIGLSQFVFDFTPNGNMTLGAGQAQNYSFTVTAPVGTPTGNYSGILNVSTNNSGYRNITLVIGVSGTNLTLDILPINVTNSNITQLNNNTYVVTANVSNPGNITAFAANLTLNLSGNFTANATFFSCGTLNVSENCSAQFLVTTKAGTPPGNFTLEVAVNYTTPEVGLGQNQTPLGVSVLSNPVLVITPTSFSANGTHGNTTTVTNFTLNSTGNDAVQNLTYLLFDFPTFNISLEGNVSSLAAGNSTVVFINMSVPLYHNPNATLGWVYVNSSNVNATNMTLQLNVSADRSWTLSTTYCESTESPDAGTVCTVTVNNTGNTFINFTIVPLSANHSTANVSVLNLTKFGVGHVLFTYNVSNVPKINYSTNFTFNVTNLGSGSPASNVVRVALIPYNLLPVNVSISPLSAEQLGGVVIYGNVTDSNIVGIINMTATVTAPNGSSYYNNMTLLRASNGTYQYSLFFPNVTGQTVHRGTYTVVVSAVDTVLAIGNATDTFSIYANLITSVDALSPSYVRGDTASLYVRAQEAANSSLSPVNTTISISNPNNLTVFNQSYTVTGGVLTPLPTFVISSDQPLGTYAVSAFSTYYDGNASQVVNDTTNSTFIVTQSGGSNVTFSGLVVNLEVGDLWYPTQTPEFAVSVYDVNGTPIDPDAMNISIIAPNDTAFAFAKLNGFTRHGPGLYSWSNFTVTTNSSGGVYLVLLNVTHGNYTTSRLTYIRVASSLLADVDTVVVWYPNSVMKFDIMVRTADGLPLDPDSMNLTVYDPANNIYTSAVLANMTRQSSGFYIFAYNMPTSTGTGAYLAYLNVSKQGMTTQNIHPFRVASGGPYDVRLQLLESEIAQGDYLDFRITVINMGEVSQDVFLEYWTEGLDGQVWKYASEAAFVGSGQTQTFLRSAFIYTSQPLGSYRMKVKMTYDNVQPPIFSNTTFLVIGSHATPTPPPGAGGGGGPGPGPNPVSVTPTPPPGSSGVPTATPEAGLAKLVLSTAPDEVVAESGETKYLKIEARNDGLSLLHNLTLLFSGVPPAWTEIRPNHINALAPNDVASFSVKLVVPKTEKTGVKSIRALVVSDEAQDEKQFNLVVFESRASLLDYALQQLEVKLGKLSKDTKDAENLGKNVDAVWTMLEEAAAYKNLATDELRKDQLDDALANVRLAEVSLAKATTLLANAQFRSQPLAGVPWWAYLIVVLFALSLAYSGYQYAKKRGLLKLPTPAPVLAPPTPEKILTTTDVAALEREKDKVRRVLRLLEEELHQGVISQTAYRELRIRNQRKLDSIEKKLKEAGA